MMQYFYMSNPKWWGWTMSKSLHEVLDVVSGNVHFVVPILIISDLKMQFPESSQISISGNTIFGHFEVIFLNVFFFRAEVVISCYYNENKILTKEWAL